MDPQAVASRSQQMVGAHQAALDAAGQQRVGVPMEQKLVRRGHQIELLQQAKTQCDRQDYVDLTIYCEDGVVRAHQMLLATASPFLKVLFQTSPLYGLEEISLILPEVKACLVQALIHFVYTGTVVSKENHFYSLMKLVYALNINASIEAESTNEKPTTFGAPLMSLSSIESPSKRKLPQQTPQVLQQVQQQQILQQGGYAQQAVSLPSQPTLVMPQLPTQPVSLPTHPVPPSKMPRMSAAVTSVAQQQQQQQQTVTLALQQQQQQQQQQQATKQMSIQLPTQPVPLAGMVNGTVVKQENATAAALHAAPQGSYIAVDPSTGMSYKVEMSNGPVAAGTADASDPLAAIMNETIFTETSAGVYTTENGQVIYQGPSGSATAVAVATAATPGTSAAGTAAAAGTPAKGKKRKAAGNKENQILAESVDDLPCTPDDEDINTPYPCERCNKTIKGRVMLQAHQYQEHYDNPELANLELGDKHACRVCLKLFTRNSDVKAHILRVHCGDRRYPCTMCGKRFKESTHLRKHLYTHTGERPHYCTLCNKGFQTSSDLKRHKKTRVHQERVENAGGIDPPSAPNPNQTPGAGAQEVTIKEEAIQQQQQQQWTTTAAATPVTAVKSVADNTAQALLNSITQPLAAPNVATPVSSAAYVAAPNSSTIDMKALGGATAWNNNQGASAEAATVAVTAAGASGTTLDLKAIGSTVDINALKWQQQSGGGDVGAAGPQGPQAIAVKRNVSVDSPSQDEERLTVVEGDDSSQDSVQQQKAMETVT